MLAFPRVAYFASLYAFRPCTRHLLRQFYFEHLPLNRNQPYNYAPTPAPLLQISDDPCILQSCRHTLPLWPVDA